MCIFPYELPLARYPLRVTPHGSHVTPEKYLCVYSFRSTLEVPQNVKIVPKGAILAPLGLLNVNHVKLTNIPGKLLAKNLV